MVAHNRKNKIKQNNGLNLLFHSFPKLNLRCKDRKHIQFASHIHQTVTSNKMNPLSVYIHVQNNYPHLLKTTRKLDEQTNQWTRLQIQNNIYTTNRVLVKQNASPAESTAQVKHCIHRQCSWFFYNSTDYWRIKVVHSISVHKRYNIFSKFW